MTSLPIVLYVVTIGHVALWVEDKKQEKKAMKESRMKMAKQTAWKLKENGRKSKHLILKLDGEAMVEVDYDDDVDYDDFFCDDPYNLTYDGIDSGVVCCPEKAEIRDCCCHWSKYGNARAVALSKVTSNSKSKKMPEKV